MAAQTALRSRGQRVVPIPDIGRVAAKFAAEIDTVSVPLYEVAVVGVR
jgi:hypothetical protein